MNSVILAKGAVILQWEKDSTRDHIKELRDIVQEHKELVNATLQQILCFPKALVGILVDYHGHEMFSATIRNNLLGFVCFISCHGHPVQTTGMHLELRDTRGYGDDVQVSALGACHKSRADALTWQAIWDFMNDPASEAANQLVTQLQCRHCVEWRNKNVPVLTFPRVELWHSLVEYSSRNQQNQQNQ